MGTGGYLKVIALAAGLVSSAAGCGSGSQAGPSWELVNDPALEVDAPSIVVRDATTVNIPDGPVYAGGYEQVNDHSSSWPAVWVTEDGSGWTRVADDAFDQKDGWINSMAADAGDVVAVGSLRKADGYVGGVWTRSAEGTWTSIGIKSDQGGDVELSDVAPSGAGRFVAVGSGRVDGQRVVVVATGSPGEEWSLAPIDGSKDAVVSSVAANGDTVVVIAGVREAGGVRSTAWVSNDGGARWDELPSGTFGETGSGGPSSIVWAGDRFMLVGTNSPGSAMQAWTSTDGDQWQDVATTVDGAPIELTPTQAVWLGRAILVVGAPTGNERFPVAAVYLPDEGWQMLGSTINPDTAHPPLGAGPATMLGQQLIFVTPVPRTVEIATVGDEARFLTAGTDPFPDSGPFLAASSLATSGQRLVVGGATGPNGGAREVSFEPVLWTGQVGALQRRDVPDAINVAAVAEDNGKTVVAGNMEGRGGEGDGSDFNDAWTGVIDAGGALSRTGQVTGPGEQFISSISHLDGRWYLTGAEQPDASELEQHAAIWTSTDLTEWTAEHGDFQSDAVTQVCSAGTRLVAVGATKDANRVSHPAVWSPDSTGAWRLVQLDSKIPTSRGSLTGCLSGDDRAVIIGTIEDSPLVIDINQDGKTSLVPFDADRDLRLADIAGSERGLVIVGTDNRRLIARPVLWASRDGHTWHQYDGPVSDAGVQSGAGAAAFAGDRLLVLGEAGSGIGLWSVDDPFSAQ